MNIPLICFHGLVETVRYAFFMVTFSK
jgi:hypothetical protein